MDLFSACSNCNSGKTKKYVFDVDKCTTRIQGSAKSHHILFKPFLLNLIKIHQHLEFFHKEEITQRFLIPCLLFSILT